MRDCSQPKQMPMGQEANQNLTQQHASVSKGAKHVIGARRGNIECGKTLELEKEQNI